MGCRRENDHARRRTRTSRARHPRQRRQSEPDRDGIHQGLVGGGASGAPNADQTGLKTVVCPNNPQQVAAEAVVNGNDIYCDASISTGEGIIPVRDLGTNGVLLDSGVTKADTSTLKETSRR